MKNIKIKRGLDIPLNGRPSDEITVVSPSLVGIVPDDFEGHRWKNCVKEGDEVNIGTPLLHDKNSGKIKLVSPIAGKVREIRRGERRKILAVVVEKSLSESSASSPEYNLSLDSDNIRSTLLESGLWSQMRQRPFDIVPDADSIPRDIFITAFDTAPLAPALYDDDDVPYIEKGLEVLGIVSGRKPYIAVNRSAHEFSNGETLLVQGPHPAGNVGVQIAAIAPVNKGETVWTLNVRSLIRIGKLYCGKGLDWSAKVAVTGPEVENPHFVDTVVGIAVSELMEPFKMREEHPLRIISGNVLTGKTVDKNGFLRFPYYQITVIEEGNEADEFMGWASMNPKKYSIKRTFPAFLRGLSKPFDFDARIKGGRRAMILSGELDKVFPFDIYPEYLLRAIQAGDIDRMEKLGIYEVAPEDFALPEFVDTSKQELQQMVRESLDMLREEL